MCSFSTVSARFQGLRNGEEQAIHIIKLLRLWYLFKHDDLRELESDCKYSSGYVKGTQKGSELAKTAPADFTSLLVF